jgi:aldose 1-epimerase
MPNTFYVKEQHMAFVVREFAAEAGGRTGIAYELTHDSGLVRAEVWPQWGFNCLRWQLHQQDGRWADLLYAAPDWETNPVPTRSGHPILFPFPGRLRDGRLVHEGKAYQLPLNDSTKCHAIHGFTPRNPWRVTHMTGGKESASITGQFSLSKDLPSALSMWPADFALNVTYTLTAHQLRVEALVENRGPGTLPFGLGYHAYFRLPGIHDADINQHMLFADAAELWDAHDNLPSGQRSPVPTELDHRTARAIGSTAFDHVFTKVKGNP